MRAAESNREIVSAIGQNVRGADWPCAWMRRTRFQSLDRIQSWLAAEKGALRHHDARLQTQWHHHVVCCSGTARGARSSAKPTQLKLDRFPPLTSAAPGVIAKKSQSLRRFDLCHASAIPWSLKVHSRLDCSLKIRFTRVWRQKAKPLPFRRSARLRQVSKCAHLLRSQPEAPSLL